MENQTFQPVLIKLSDFLLKEPMEVTHSDNLSTKQQVEETHFDNLSNEEVVEINHFGNLFVKELVQSNIRGLTVDNMTKRRMDDDLSEPELVQIGISDLLTQQLVENQLDSPNST
jgi:hypothetical protein